MTSAVPRQIAKGYTLTITRLFSANYSSAGLDKILSPTVFICNHSFH